MWIALALTAIFVPVLIKGAQNNELKLVVRGGAASLAAAGAFFVSAYHFDPGPKSAGAALDSAKSWLPSAPGE